MKKLLVIAALVLTAGTAFAAGADKAAKVVACQNFTIAKLDNGATMGVCSGSAEGMGRKGKKPRFLTSYTVAKVADPSGALVSVLVGFQ